MHRHLCGRQHTKHLDSRAKSSRSIATKPSEPAQRPAALSRLLVGELGQEITHGHHVTKLVPSWDCGFTMHRVRLAAGAVQLLTSSDSEDGQAVKAKPPGGGGLVGTPALSPR